MLLTSCVVTDGCYYHQGDLTPDNAKSTLSLYEGKFLRLKEDRENISKAKEALELETGIVCTYAYTHTHTHTHTNTNTNTHTVLLHYYNLCRFFKC